MILLSPIALLFGLAALVPLILHLYQRRRRTVIEFSTNRFFTATIIRSQRRLRLRRLLLLLLRMGACILLALALARPILNLAGFGTAGGRDLVILLDDSLSMQAVEGRDQGSEGSRDQGRQAGTGVAAARAQRDTSSTRFDQARRIAVDVLNGLASGDRAAVVTFTGRTLGHRAHAGLELTGDLLGLAGEVERTKPTVAAGDAHAALALASDLLKQPGPRHSRLLILSDLQETDWHQSAWPTPPHTVGAAVVRLNPPTEDNVAADQMVLSQGTAVVGQPNLLRVRLVNYRPETTTVPMVLRVDDQEQVRRPVELPGSSPHIERIPLTFAESGAHRLTLSIEPHDALPADDTLFSTVIVNPQLAVLLVDGQAGSSAAAAAGGRQSAALYLRAAMRAISSEGNAVQLDAVDPADLPAVTLENHRVVIFSAVKSLPVAQVERVEKFVQSGGGLAVFLSEGADRDFYNNLLGGPNRPLGGLLPAEVRDFVDTEGGNSLGLVEADLDHPMLQRFKDSLRSALAGVSVYRAYALVPREAWVVASLDRQLPFIVERSYGRGKVLLFAAPPDPRWTNLPLRRLFLPLTSRMVSYLAGGGSGEADHVVGQPIVLLRGGWDVDQPVYVVRPDGSRVRAAVNVVGAEPVAVLPASAVDQAGFYKLELPAPSPRSAAGDASAAPARGAPTGPAETVLAVNVPRSESVPRVLDLDGAKKLAGNWRLQDVEVAGRALGANDEEIATALLTGGPGGRGVWDALLWAVLMLVLLEPLIANRIIGSRPTETDDRRGGLAALRAAGRGRRVA